MWRFKPSQSKTLDAVLLAACKKILCCSSKTCSEAVQGDLGIKPLDLRRVIWFLRLLKKARVLSKFLIKNGINIKLQI